MSDEIITTERNTIALGNRGVQLATLDDGWRFARMVASSGFAPKGMEKPEAILVAVQMGLECGMTPMMALQNTAVINGRPAIYGDAALALVRGSGLCESYAQRIEGMGDARKAVVIVKRRGDPAPITSEFSMADAKRAGLLGKSGPWSQYPERMLVFRARGFALRDAFGDVLKGLKTAEEVADYAPAVDVPTASPRLPEPPKQATAPTATAERDAVAELLYVAERCGWSEAALAEYCQRAGLLAKNKPITAISNRSAEKLLAGDHELIAEAIKNITKSQTASTAEEELI